MIDKVYNILKQLNFPIKYQLRPNFGKGNTVLSYHFFNTTHAYHGDGKGKNFIKNLQVDLFYKGKLNNLDKNIIKLLENEGFRFNDSYEAEDSLNGIRLYHIVMRFNYLEREGN